MLRGNYHRWSWIRSFMVCVGCTHPKCIVSAGFFLISPMFCLFFGLLVKMNEIRVCLRSTALVHLLIFPPVPPPPLSHHSNWQVFWTKARACSSSSRSPWWTRRMRRHWKQYRTWAKSSIHFTTKPRSSHKVSPRRNVKGCSKKKKTRSNLNMMRKAEAPLCSLQLSCVEIKRVLDGFLVLPVWPRAQV